MKQRHIIAGLFFGVVVYAMFALWGDAGKIAHAFAQFQWSYGVLALVLVCVGYGVRFWKWSLYLKHLGLEVETKLSAVVFFAGMVMSITPGKVGEVLKSVLLKEAKGIDVASTAPVVMMERITDLLGLCVIAALGVLMFGQGVWPLMVCLGLMVVGLFVLSQARLMDWLICTIEKMKWGVKLGTALREAHDSIRLLLAPGVLLNTTLMSVVSWGLEGVAFYFIIVGLGGVQGVLVEAMSIFSLTTIMGALSFLPGGVGVTEGGMVGLLMWFKIFEVEAQALAATYLIRLVTLWFGVGLGGVAFAMFGRIYSRGEGTE